MKEFKRELKEIVREYMLENGLSMLQWRGTGSMVDTFKEELRDALEEVMNQVIEES